MFDYNAQAQVQEQCQPQEGQKTNHRGCGRDHFSLASNWTVETTLLLAGHEGIPRTGGNGPDGINRRNVWTPVKTIIAGREGVPCQGKLKCKWNTPSTLADTWGGGNGGASDDMRGGASRGKGEPTDFTVVAFAPTSFNFGEGSRNPGLN